MEVPKLWHSVTNFGKTSQHTLNERDYVTKMANYPASWRMNHWNQTDGGPPEGVIIRVRDPLRVLAFLLNDPALVYGNSEHVSFEPKEVVREVSGSSTSNLVVVI